MRAVTPDASDLDGWARRIENGAPREVWELFCLLEDVRASLNFESWRLWLADVREHPVFGILREDPYTDRAYSKPRGYPGDAEMLDLVYFGLEDAFAHDRATSDRGRAI